jgi:hypothetical protein
VILWASGLWTLFSLVDGTQCFGGTHCLHLEGNGHHVLKKMLLLIYQTKKHRNPEQHINSAELLQNKPVAKCYSQVDSIYTHKVIDLNPYPEISYNDQVFPIIFLRYSSQTLASCLTLRHVCSLQHSFFHIYIHQ